MKKFDLTPKDPQAELKKLAAEREAILGKISNPLARTAVRAASVFGVGKLAENTWQTHHTKKKIIR